LIQQLLQNQGDFPIIPPFVKVFAMMQPNATQGMPSTIT
jgi:hypothetical protein